MQPTQRGTTWEVPAPGADQTGGMSKAHNLFVCLGLPACPAGLLRLPPCLEQLLLQLLVLLSESVGLRLGIPVVPLQVRQLVALHLPRPRIACRSLLQWQPESRHVLEQSLDPVLVASKPPRY